MLRVSLCLTRLHQDIGILDHDADMLSLQLIDHLKNREDAADHSDEASPPSRRKNSKRSPEFDPGDPDSIPDAKDEERRRLNKAQEEFAKFMAMCRITEQDLDDLFCFSQACLFRADSPRSFCPAVRYQASLGSRLNSLWSRLNSAGLHALGRSGRLEKELTIQSVQEKRVICGDFQDGKKKKDE